MTMQVEMKGRICPFMSDPRGMVMCQGDKCNAFNSRPTYEYLNKKMEVRPRMGDLRMFDKEDVGQEITDLLQIGWERTYPQYTSTSLRRKIEPECWCDAMPANAPQYGYEAQ